MLPAYNESGRIGDTVLSVRKYVDEVLVVDDGSHDSTGSEAEEAGAIVLRNPSNLGYIPSIKRAFQAAQGDVIVILDGDGELPADKIPELVSLIQDGSADMVQGHRSVPPRISERFLTWLAQKKAPVGDSGTGMRALRKTLAQELEIKSKCICGVLSLEAVYRGARIREVPIQLNLVNKPRRIAWYHFQQFFYLLPWLFKSYPKKGQKI